MNLVSAPQLLDAFPLIRSRSVDDASQRFGVSLLEVVAGGGLKQPTKAPQEASHA